MHPRSQKRNLKMKLALAICYLTACTVSALNRRNIDGKDSPTSQHRVGIEGGKLIDIEKRPYTVSVIFLDYYQGVGVLIDKNWVLTAASNVYYWKASDTTVRVASNDCTKGGELLNTSKIVVHPEYNGSWPNDLALLKLSKPAKISEKVKPISLASTLPNAGTNTIVTGYGATSSEFTSSAFGLLREAAVPFITYQTCKSFYTSDPPFSSKSFCASKEKVGACAFDQGAPLVYKNKLIGIYSGSNDVCDSAKWPGVYSDVTQFNKWIKDTIRP